MGCILLYKFCVPSVSLWCYNTSLAPTRKNTMVGKEVTACAPQVAGHCTQSTSATVSPAGERERANSSQVEPRRWQAGLQGEQNWTAADTAQVCFCCNML